MRDFFLERPGLMIGIFFAVLILFYVEPWNRSKKIQQIQREAEGRSGEARPATKESSSRMQEASKLRYQEPLKALALVEEILAQPAEAKEREAAQTLLPDLLELAYHKHARDKQFEDARKIMERLVTQFPGHRTVLGVRLSWGRTLGEQLRAAATANDAAKVEALFKEYASGGYHLPRRDPQGQRFSGDSQVLQEYARFQLARWKALPAENRTQGEGLALATEAFGVILEHNEAWRLSSFVQEKPPVFGRELLELAQRFDQQGMVPQAFAAHVMANGFLRSGRNWDPAGKRDTDYKARQDLIHQNEAHIAKLVQAMAAKLEADPSSVLTSMTPDQFIGMAFNQVQAAEHRTGLHEQRLALATKEYLADTLPLTRYDLLKVADDSLIYEAKLKLSEQLHQARNQGNRIENELRRALFENLTQDTNAALWPKVPPQVIAEIERTVPANTRLERLEAARRETLRRLVREGKALNPVGSTPEFQERRLQVAALNGVYLLGSNREESFRDLRAVIHEGGSDTLKGRVRQAVQTAFRLSRKLEKFDALIELAGFYAAEYGDTLVGDPFRDELRKALETTAGKFKAGEKMKYVFVQALMASAFAGEELGRKAQQETIARAFELVQGVTTEKSFGPVKLPSSLAGWSTVAVDNSTEHHILLVYDGPESFSVLCKPQRKGSFALKNGAYRIAVMTPLGNIRPYRAERTFADEHAPADYHIQQSGGSSRNDPMRSGGGSAYGNYTLLRLSEGLPDAQVDSRTGVFKKPL